MHEHDGSRGASSDDYFRALAKFLNFDHLVA